MSDRPDDETNEPASTPSLDGSAYAASSSESGGLYNEDGATIGTPGGVPLSDEDDDQPQGEDPDIADVTRSR